MRTWCNLKNRRNIFVGEILFFAPAQLTSENFLIHKVENTSEKKLSKFYWKAGTVTSATIQRKEVPNLLRRQNKFIYPSNFRIDSHAQQWEKIFLKVCFSRFFFITVDKISIDDELWAIYFFQYCRIPRVKFMVQSTTIWTARTRRLRGCEMFRLVAQRRAYFTLTHFMSLIRWLSGDGRKQHELFIIMNIYDLIRFSQYFSNTEHWNNDENIISGGAWCFSCNFS